MSDLPTLTDGTVTLRAHRADELDAIVEQCHDEASLRWTTVPRGYTRADAEEFVARVADAWRDARGNRYWAIEFAGDEGTPQFGGTIDLRPGEGPDYASIGFGLHPAARGKGVMSRAVRLVAGYAFETGPWGRPLARVHWRAIAGNWGSKRVAWATGFTFHGTMPGTHLDPADRDNAASLDAWHGSLAAGEPMEPQYTWFEPPTLKGDGIRLRAMREDDKRWIEPRDDPEHWVPVRSVLRQETWDSTLFRQRLFASDGVGVGWAIADEETDALLGTTVVFSRGGPMTGDVAELGYQLNPSARGRGVAKEAARLAIGHALSPKDAGGLGLRRLIAETSADNVGSNKVLESQGFESFGRERGVEQMADGTWGDFLHWQLAP
jgi:RimJ/RimL family protein N-acetyltransferase